MNSINPHAFCSLSIPRALANKPWIPSSSLTRSTGASCLLAERFKGVDTVLGQHLESILGDLLATLECQEMGALD